MVMRRTILLPVFIKYRGIEYCPEAATLAASLKAGIGPGIAGIEKAIPAGGLIESIGRAIVGRGSDVDDVAAGIFAKATDDK